ncbi:hypothetical protein QN277_008999 [Acacia crassicarpa]|uniref:Myosin motor domain-containing protein n=1 Tax=Acacia crassicarpa TaxID=499986 RepID=A0AAE1IRE4_9FABA|nr:hypothetical protein QN277_008999 [Acacia crassicarpa]
MHSKNCSCVPVLPNFQYACLTYDRDVVKQTMIEHETVFRSQSKAGPILIAFNPFKDVQICGNDHATTYRQRCMTDPHVYAVANAAYNEMMRVRARRDDY